MSNEKNNGISVSFSSASRFKACPTKFYLSKQYRTKLSPSAFPFGKAVEAGVIELLLGGSLEDAQDLFQENWHSEEMGADQPRRLIFDNSAIEFYASDFDKNLIFGEAEEQVYEWSTELFGDTDENWQETFEGIALRIKDKKNLGDNERTFYNRVIWLCCLIRGFTMIEAFKDKLLHKLKVYTIDGKPAIQKEITITNAEGDKIPGFIDLIVYHEDYDHPITIDLKTAAYPYTSHALDTSEQLRTYVSAVGAEIGSYRAGYIVLLKKLKVEKSCDSCGAKREGMAKNCKSCGKGQYTVPKLEGDVQFLTKEYTNDELEDVLNDYMNVVVAIKNKVNFKNPSNCTQYGRQCEFYDMCWKQKKPEELEHLESKKVLTENSEADTNET